MKAKLILKKSIIAFLFIFSVSTSAKAFTAVASGNWSNAATWGGIGPGGTVTAQDIIIPLGITVSLDMPVTFTGIANSFNVNGALVSVGTNGLTITQGTLTGNGSITINNIVFGTLATSSYVGVINAGTLRNNGAAMVIDGITTISDTLDLISGNLMLNSGANLSMLSNSTIKRSDGTLTISGGIFNSSADYNVYYSGSSKLSGIELNTSTLQNLIIQMADNSQALTLNSNLVVNGDVNLNQGWLVFGGRSLTIHGDFTSAPGALLNGNSTSNLIMQDNNPPAQPLMFASGASLNNFTIDYSGSDSLKLGSPIEIFGNVQLIDGTLSLESGGGLTMNGGSTLHRQNGEVVLNGGTFTGTAAYNVEYSGATAVTGLEMTGSGLNNVSINLPFASDLVAIANDLTINGNLNLSGGFLNLNGKKLVLNGLLTQIPSSQFSSASGSELVLNMSSAANDTIFFNPTYNTLKKITVNMGGSSNIVLGNSVIVTEELSLLNGKIILYDSDLYIASTGSITGYNDSRYIVTSGTGRLVMNVNSSAPYVTFPIGTMASYSPAHIQQTSSGTSGNFSVRTMPGVYANGTTGFNSATVSSVVDRTWIIDHASGVILNSNIRLGWKSTAEVNGFDRMNSFISHYNGLAWDSQTAAAASVGLHGTYEMIRLGMNSLSPLAVVDTDAILEVVEDPKTEGFNIYPNPANDFVMIQNSGANNFRYELIDVSGKSIMTLYNNVNMSYFDLKQVKNGCYFIKATNLDNKQVVTRKFIKG